MRTRDGEAHRRRPGYDDGLITLYHGVIGGRDGQRSRTGRRVRGNGDGGQGSGGVVRSLHSSAGECPYGHHRIRGPRGLPSLQRCRHRDLGLPLVLSQAQTGSTLRL